MKRVVLIFVISILTITCSFAQQQISKEESNRKSQLYAEQWKKNRMAGELISNQNGIPIRQVLSDGRIIELYGYINGRLEYFTTNNINAAKTISTNKVWPSGNLYDLTGNDITLGIWDGGRTRITHVELSERATQKDQPLSISNHATHVAGTMIASGVKGSAIGMAYEAKLDCYDWNDHFSEINTAAGNGLLISNHSWGSIRGWYEDIDSNVWYWYGDISISESEDYQFGFYSTESATWDGLAYDNPYHLIVKAAGNDRNDYPANQPINHKILVNNQWTDVSTIRESDGGADGYDCLEGSGVSKNTLTVAAVEDIINGYSQSSDVQMSSFSSWGPTDDGRIKPDISANGVELYSLDGISDNSYTTMSGTSMATPNVTGSIGLLIKHYKNLHGTDKKLLASTLKGLIIHTADEAGESDGPDYKYGWGLMNTKSAADFIQQDYNVGGFNIQEIILSNNNPIITTYYSDGTKPIKVTICWTDPQGNPVAASLNPRDKMLINDLDLKIVDEQGNVFYPWSLSYESPTNAATKNGTNNIDNVEQVYIKNPTAGLYTIYINHKGSLKNNQQYFSLLISNLDPKGTVTIGQQIWMNKNLDVAYYRNGDPIPQVTDPTVWAGLTTGAWCYYNNDPLLGAIYGKLYNWYAVNDPRGLAPEGWHVPSDAEWTVLTNYLGGYSIAGGKMKETGYTHWYSPNTGATNESGFTGLPGGFRSNNGSYWGLRGNGYWWSSTEDYATDAWYRHLGFFSTDLDSPINTKVYGFSVRCVKDEEPPPTLLSPTNNATDQPRNLTFKWETLTGATEYQIQASTSQDFSSLTLDTKTTSTSLIATSLSNSKTYYWRVRAKKGDMLTPWSELWKFTTQTGSIDLESGLVAYYPFTGGSTDDFSGNGNNGTNNGATKTTDRFGNTDCAYSFDGADDYISLSNEHNFHLQNFSLSIWINLTTYKNSIFITKDDWIKGFMMCMHSDNGIVENCIAHNNTWTCSFNPNFKIELNSWQLFIFSYDGNYLKIYTQGNIVNEFQINTQIEYGNMPVYFGASQYGGYFHGKLDDIRIYNRALSDAEVAALYYEGNNTPKKSPGISCYSNIKQGTTFYVSLMDFTPNEQVKVFLNGQTNYEFTTTANSGGSNLYEINSNDISAGNYEVVAYDTKTGVYSNKKTVIITADEQLKQLLLIQPQAESLPKNTSLRVIWSDYMSVVSGYSISGPKRNYHYKIYIKLGDDEYIPCSDDKTGWADKNTQQNFEINYALAAVVNEVKIKVVDVLQNNRFVESPVFSVTDIPTGFKVDKLWDNSKANPPSDRKINPFGVVADGISRIVLKVKKIDPERVIQSVKAEIIGSDMKTFGKLCHDVNYNNSYYDITSNQTPGLVKSIDGTNDNYYFWYISPEDFVSDPIDKDNDGRNVYVRFTVTYDNSVELSFEKIEIKRVPLILVHGIADSKEGWSNFKTSKTGNGNTGYFNSDQRWISEVPSLMKFESFEVNANIVKSQISHLIDKALIQGYAANQVDYVCHSMGGSILRTFEESDKLKFYTDEIYRTYSKGYVHKFITLNTPHNGTPVADVVFNEILPYLNSDQVTSDLAAGLHATAISNFNVSFLETIENRTLERPWYQLGDKQVWYATAALLDLLEKPVNIDGKLTGAVKHKQTNLKSHLIAADIISGYQNLPDVPQSVWNIVNISDNLIEILDKYLDWKFNLATRITEFFGGELQSIYKIADKKIRVFRWLNRLVKGYATVDYLVDSDFFVPLNSQIPDFVSNSRTFSTNYESETLHFYWHNNMRDQSDVGNYVFDLLHEPLSSTIFDKIPESKVPESVIKQEKQEQEQQENNLPSFTIMPTLTVFTPNDSISVNPDSLMNISFSVSSTDGLFLKKIYFQDISLVDTTLYDYANYDVLVSGTNLGKQNLTVMAFYVYSDTSFVLTKNLLVYVNPVENPIELIAEPEMNYLKINEIKYINTKAIFKNFITDVSYSDSLKISIEDTNIVKYQNNRFVGKSEGMTSVEFSYMGTIDSVWFEVNGILPIPDTIPTLLYPQNLSKNIVLNDTLKWLNPANTNFIDIQVATDTLFSQLVYTNTVFNDSLSVLNIPEKMKTYYWHVKAVGLGGESGWSETWSFTTEPYDFTIPLSQGWNMISSFVAPQEPDSLQYVSANIKGNLIIAKNNNGAAFIPKYEINDIGKWGVTQGYQVYMSTADTLVVTGLAVNPSETQIALYQGWNMISYLRNTELDCETAFASLDDGNLIIVKDNYGNVYIPSYEINTIGNLVPGQGYQIYVLNAAVLVYPGN